MEKIRIIVKENNDRFDFVKTEDENKKIISPRISEKEGDYLVHTFFCGNERCGSCGFYEKIGIDGDGTGYCVNNIMKPKSVVDSDMLCKDYVKVDCATVTEIDDKGIEKYYFTIGRGGAWDHSKAIECTSREDAIYLERFFEGIKMV